MGLFARLLPSGPLSASALAASSAAALDADLRGARAALLVAEGADDGVLLGAFQRPADLEGVGLPAYRRGSGGAAIRLAPRTLAVQLTLAHAGALVPCEPSRVLNRYVRPLLRGLTRAGATARYFERDWVSVAHRPAVAVAFAHDTGTGRTCFEAYVGLGVSPFAAPARASFQGKEAAGLEAIVGRSFDVERLVALIAESYTYAYAAGAVEERAFDLAPVAPARIDGAEAAAPGAWTAIVEEAIGPVAAGRDGGGRLVVGGELMASRDALARLGARCSGRAFSREEALACAREELEAPGVACYGVRDLGALADVIARASAVSAARSDT